jgi:transposase
MGKHFSPEYKEYVSKLVVKEGRKASEVAYELELSYKTVSRWVANYREKVSAEQTGSSYITPTELERLKNNMKKKSNS